MNTVDLRSKPSLYTKLRDQIKKILKKSISTNSLIEIICAALIILFIYTGINKLMEVNKFRTEMERSPFIQNFASIIAYALPIGELGIAALLIIKRTKLVGLYFSFALMAMFTGYIWLMLNYAYDLPCSCGGIISKLSWHDHLIFNSVFTLLSLLAIILQSRPTKTSTQTSSKKY